MVAGVSISWYGGKSSVVVGFKLSLRVAILNAVATGKLRREGRQYDKKFRS